MGGSNGSTCLFAVYFPTMQVALGWSRVLVMCAPPTEYLGGQWAHGGTMYRSKADCFPAICTTGKYARLPTPCNAAGVRQHCQLACDVALWPCCLAQEAVLLGWHLCTPAVGPADLSCFDCWFGRLFQGANCLWCRYLGSTGINCMQIRSGTLAGLICMLVANLHSQGSRECSRWQ